MATMPAHLRSIVDHHGAVILDSSRNAMTILDATGAYVWQRLNRGMPLDTIVAELARDTASTHEQLPGPGLFPNEAPGTRSDVASHATHPE
jgi:hypothetical protein